jgi:hypothetical protein
VDALAAEVRRTQRLYFGDVIFGLGRARDANFAHHALLVVRHGKAYQ